MEEGKLAERLLLEQTQLLGREDLLGLFADLLEEGTQPSDPCVIQLPKQLRQLRRRHLLRTVAASSSGLRDSASSASNFARIAQLSHLFRGETQSLADCRVRNQLEAENRQRDGVVIPSVDNEFAGHDGRAAHVAALLWRRLPLSRDHEYLVPGASRVALPRLLRGSAQGRSVKSEPAAPKSKSNAEAR